MKESVIRPIFICFIILFTSACQDETLAPQTEELLLSQDGNIPGYVQCPENRPDLCTQIYQPVCGSIDTGIRCITTPCPSVEQKTFSNACTACSDKKVGGYVDGECETGKDNNSPD